MNYYNKGGQAYGLKSLAQELPKYGRYGDDVVAHISSDEAKMLQAMGGSGTINPQTGLPEFFKIRNPFKPVQRAIGQLNPLNKGSAVGSALQQVPGVKEAQNIGTQIFQPIEKAVVQPASRGLASFDKAVGKAIPGGWGTVGSIALSAMGAPVPLQVAYGAARGSGVMNKGGSFNLQGAMIGGATAYATAKLGDYLRAAAPGAEGASNMATLPESAVDLSSGVNAATGQVGSGLAGNSSGMLVDPSLVTSSNTAALNSLSASMEAGVGAGLQVAPPPSVFSQLASGNIGDAVSQIGSNIASGANSAYDSGIASLKSMGTDIASAADKYTTPSTYSQMLDKGLSNASQTGSGIKNLITGPAGVSKAASTLSGVNPVAMSGMALYGETALSDLDAQRDFLNQQRAAGKIAQAEYDQALAEINRQRDYAARVVKDNPFSTNPDRDTSIGETYYGRGSAEDTLYGRGNANTTLYAMGGSVDDESGMDEARGIMQGNLQKGLFGQGYAAGGSPRFLSGGGDGMSDSIPATINGSQEARLADGEFVIPADVVSHLGNGSSKAGAKQLYSMMDKVRKARTGNPKQGKQINPRKYLAA